MSATEAPAKTQGEYVNDDQTPRRNGIPPYLEKLAIPVLFAAMIAVFWLITPDVFGTWTNAKNILDQAAVVLILAAGLTLVLSTNEFDLSFPGVIIFAGAIATKMLNNGSSSVVAIVVAMAIGVGAELVAGALVATQLTSSFIITLALNTFWGGLAAGLSNGGQPIPVTNQSFTDLALKTPLGIPVAVYLAVIIVVIAGFLLRFTVFGRHAAAIGTNAVAARFAGIRLSWVRLGVFAFLGLCAGLSAAILTARQGQFTTQLSLGLFIPPFVAAFFGVSVLNAGRFNVLGTAVGALFIATLQTGLIISGADAWAGDVMVGVVLIVTLFVAAKIKTGTGDG
jgi:ribose transport system permease protein